MSKLQILRCLVNQRLTAAAEEVFGLFERTIAEYEEERRKLLQTRADVQQPLVLKEEVPPEQQEWRSGLDQEDPEPPHIKEEQEELSIQEGEQLQGLEEVYINFPFTLVTVKTEEDVDERDQSSQLHESHTEDNRGAELLKTEADEDDCGGSESASNSDPDGPFQPATHDETSSSSESETDVSSSDWEETGEPPSGPNPLQNNDVNDDDGCNTGYVEGARSFGHEGRLQKLSPLGVHSDGKRFGCPVCKTSFSSSASLVRHIRTHSGEKPFSSSVCGKKFTLNRHMKRHLALHTGEKLFSCSLCSRRYTQQGSLTRHMTSHTEEKLFSCSFCGKGFSHQGNLKQHLTSHTGGKPFSCSECGRGFAQKELLKQHMVVHTGEKPFGCSVCSKRFTQHGSLTRHLALHTGEKPFTCGVCGRGFSQHSSLKRHLTAHRRGTI
ncbi:uncharacterized protein LOC142939171 [Anarhichas minor]|uniref:uncharacterized protein LOC142939171 n=1 Tax=Anarhichas minor TaxID=65739 RepID=UPI003F736B89